MPDPAAAICQIVETLEGVGASVDTEAAVIRGVKLIGSRSKNGRDYPAQVLRDAVPLYEGVRVNIDHPDKPTTPRRVSDRIGLIKSARYVEGASAGVYGDLHYNPKHPLADQVAWEAEHNPGALGLSHNASLRMGPKRDGRDQVEAIGAVRSVDLVADPATTSGFFEHDESDADEGLISDALRADEEFQAVNRVIRTAMDLMRQVRYADGITVSQVRSQTSAIARDLINELKSGTTTEANDMDLATLTLEQLTAERPDLVAAVTAAQESTDELQKLRARVEAFEAQEAARKHAETIESELAASALDPANPKHVSEAFRATLTATESAETRATLIADRVELVEGLTTTPPPKPRTTNTTEATAAPTPADRRKNWQRALTR